MTDLGALGLKNIRLELHDDGVLIATLDRAHKRNALDADTVEELVSLFSAIPRAGVRAVVLGGRGRPFLRRSGSGGASRAGPQPGRVHASVPALA